MASYRSYLQNNQDGVGEVYSYIRIAAERGMPACLTCYERNFNECHRSIIIEELCKYDVTVETIHLPLEIEQMQPLRHRNIDVQEYLFAV